jgi:predicted Zn-dependent protease
MRKELTTVVKTLDLVLKDELVWHGQALLLGALSHVSLGHTEAAVLYLDRYVKAHPKRAGPRKMLASIYVDQGKNGRAVDMLEPMLETAPNDMQVLSLLAAASMAQGRHFEAINYFEKALKVSGGAPDVRSEFGVSLIASGQEQLGFKQVQQAFAKDLGQVRGGIDADDVVFEARPAQEGGRSDRYRRAAKPQERRCGESARGSPYGCG